MWDKLNGGIRTKMADHMKQAILDKGKLKSGSEKKKKDSAIKQMKKKKSAAV